MASLAQMGRELLAERTKAGLAAAKAKGRADGRKRKMTQSKIESAKQLLASGTLPKDVAHDIGISVPTLYFGFLHQIIWIKISQVIKEGHYLLFCYKSHVCLHRNTLQSCDPILTAGSPKIDTTDMHVNFLIILYMSTLSLILTTLFDNYDINNL